MPETSPSAGAIFVLPVTTDAQWGPVAAWISTSGWAAAAERVLGGAWIVTPKGVLDVAAVRREATRTRGTTSGGSSYRRFVPTVAKTFLKDVREWRRARGFEIDPTGPWSDPGTTVDFVWQRHELFHTAGVDLAHRLGVPSVLFVPAVLVWQAEQWSVHRPGWGRIVERWGEVPALHAADVVACGSEPVADEVLRLWVEPSRVIVTPTGVDLGLFAPSTDRARARRQLALHDEFVVGWVGSFRPFHAIDQLVAAVTGTEMVLVFVGDGPERRRIERLVEAAGVRAVFTGTVAHVDLPHHLAAMDAAVVLSNVDPSGSYHYSPLKVAEYLAAGVPAIVPSVGPLSARLHHGENALLYPPGDVARLRSELLRLSSDSELRARLREGALASAPNWAWDRQVERVRAALHLTR
jgi:glycosyltransferase involved in cell wall biosynthesis